jgi:hypothetical protein
MILIGIVALIAGTSLIVMKTLDVLSVTVSSLWAYGPSLFQLEPRPIPPFDFLWPALAVLGGLLVFSIEWVAIIKGASLAWPHRFDRSARR